MSNTTIKMMGRLQDHFTMISNEFARDPNVTSRAARLFMYIASHETGWSLSITATENATGLKRGTIFEALKDLRKLGYVKRYQNVDERGRFSGTEYQVFLLPLPEDERDDIAVSANNRVRENRTRSDQQECDESAGGSRVRKNRIRKNRIRKNDTLKKTNTKKTNLQENQLKEDKPPIVPQGGQAAPSATESDEPALADAPEIQTAPKPKRKPEPDYGNDFDEWYTGYPLKVSKKAARRAYEKARKEGATREELLEGLERSRRSWANKGTEKRYIPHPSTWLNQGKWEDEEFTYEDSLPRTPAAENPLEIARRMAQREHQQTTNYQFQPQPPRLEITQ